MKKSKKITALILAAMLAVSSSAAMAVTVSAEENTAVAYSSSDTKSWGDYDYQVLDDGTVEIMHYKGSDNNLVIPSEIDGKKVTSIGIGAFDTCTSLTSIKIPNGVVNIAPAVFFGCTNLKSIIIPDSVTSIGVDAFACCSNLNNVKIPNSVTFIGGGAFGSCTSLANIEIPDSVTIIGIDAFDYTPWYNNQPDGLIYAGKVAYRYKGEMSKNAKITLKDDTVGIAGYAFADCINLTNIEIPNSVTVIADKAFINCTNLTNIEIPNSVTTIGYGTFSGCKNLNNIKIPNSVTYIGSEAFKDCNNLTIYGYAGSYVEKYANDYNIPFFYTKTLISQVGNIFVEGTFDAFDDGVTLNVEEATVKNAVKAYNITLKDENGNTIQPNGKITVSIPSDNANCKVYWIKEDGTKVDMNATYSNGNYEFTTDHLSVYALIADTTEPSQESSGEQNNSSSESSGEQSNNPSEPSNNTNSSKTTSETGKNAVNTGDNNNAVAIATIFAIGALIAAIIMRKKKA